MVRARRHAALAVICLGAGLLISLGVGLLINSMRAAGAQELPAFTVEAHPAGRSEVERLVQSHLRTAMGEWKASLLPEFLDARNALLQPVW
jgi:hypothetical protein